MNRPLGLHLRFTNNIIELLNKARTLEIQFFQCFVRQSGILAQPERQDILLFRKERERLYHNFFVHISYIVNLADHRMRYHPALEQELALARALGATHILFHPGANASRLAGIDAIARALNKLTRKIPEFTVLLENVAFSSPSIGGNLEDLKEIRAKLDMPERIGFCIDTAHAFSYGYDLTNQEQLENFINILSQLDTSSIALIHANNTTQLCASHHDTHCRLAEGNLAQALQVIGQNSQLKHIPFLLELPATITNQEEREDLDRARSWFL